MIYIFIIILILFLTNKYDFQNHIENKKSSFWFLFIILVCLAGFRYYIGTDTYQYRQEYDRYPEITNFSLSEFKHFRYQPIWMVLVMIVRFFSKDFVLLQFVVAIVLNLGVFKRTWQYSPKPFVTIFIYFMTLYLISNFELIRESVAVGTFLLFGLNNLLKRKLIKFYLCTIVCYFIHPGAIVLFLLPFIPLKPVNPSKALPHIVGFSIVVIFFKAYFAEYMILLLGDNSTINVYATGIANDYGTKKIGYYLNYYYPYFINAVLLIFLERKCKKVLPFTNYILLTIFFGVLSDLHHSFLRLNNYLILFTIVFHTYSVIFIKIKYRFVKLNALLLFTTVYLLTFFYFLIFKQTAWVEGSKAKSYNRWLPYCSVFEELTDSQREMIKYYNTVYFDQMYIDKYK